MLKKLNDIFDVTYGNKFDFNKMRLAKKSDGGVNFVGRSSQNMGVTGVVAPTVSPFPAGAITVSLGGSKLLSSFIQLEPFYTAQNVAVLQAKEEMTFAQKLYVCLCIRHNRFRYSAFGREANRTLRTLPVPAPESFPEWVAEMDTDRISKNFAAPAESKPVPALAPGKWEEFALADIFNLEKGKRLTKAAMAVGDTPFIGAIASNNGVRQRIASEPLHPGNVITVSYNGSVGEAFYQPAPFWASDDINVLYPKFEMDPALGMFLCAIIRREKYRFNYGRKWGLEKMRVSRIRLPVVSKGKPDWAFMRRYIQTLPYSSQLA